MRYLKKKLKKGREQIKAQLDATRETRMKRRLMLEEEGLKELAAKALAEIDDPDGATENQLIAQDDDVWSASEQPSLDNSAEANSLDNSAEANDQKKVIRIRNDLLSIDETPELLHDKKVKQRAKELKARLVGKELVKAPSVRRTPLNTDSAQLDSEI